MARVRGGSPSPIHSRGGGCAFLCFILAVILIVLQFFVPGCDIRDVLDLLQSAVRTEQGG